MVKVQRDQEGDRPCFKAAHSAESTAGALRRLRQEGRHERGPGEHFHRERVSVGVGENPQSNFVMNKLYRAASHDGNEKVDSRKLQVWLREEG